MRQAQSSNATSATLVATSFSDEPAVLSPERELLYLSSEPALDRESQDLLVSVAQLSDTGHFGEGALDPPAGTVHYYSRPIRGAGPSVGWVISAASIADLVLTPRGLLTAMLVTAAVIAAGLLADLGYALADPRVRLERRSAPR